MTAGPTRCSLRSPPRTALRRSRTPACPSLRRARTPAPSEGIRHDDVFGLGVAWRPRPSRVSRSRNGASIAPAAAGESALPVADPTMAPDAYIVVVDAAAGPQVASAVADAAVSAGATIGHTYSAAIHGFSATLPTPVLAAVLAADGVAYVARDAAAVLEPSGARGPDGVQPDPPWNLDRIDQRNLPLNETYKWHKSGAGVTAYVIDSGIRFTHTDFEGRAVSGPDFYDDDDDSADCNGHGTHVAGTLGGTTYGVAKDVSLVGIRVLGCAGTGMVSDVLAAFDWVIANSEGRSVINLSMQFGGPNQAIDDAIAAAFAEGILVSCAGTFRWGGRLRPITRPSANRRHGCCEHDI